MSRIMTRKGEESAPFHWIYVLVAGGVILLFFVGIVIRQKASSEKELSAVVLRKLDAIFAGASLSEQTVNVVDIPELELYFVCDETGSSEYRIGKAQAKSDIPVQPFFAPSAVTTTRLVTWTIPLAMPFHVMNLLYVGSPAVTYVVLYERDDIKKKIEKEMPKQFNFQYQPARGLSTLPHVPTKFVKLIFLDATGAGSKLPPSIAQLPDGNVHAIELRGGQGGGVGEVLYFKKRGNALVQNGPKVPFIAQLSEDDKSASFYAAIFSDDAISYQCNMAKAFRRMALLADVYSHRLAKINEAYASKGSQHPDYACSLRARTEEFDMMRTLAEGCMQSFSGECAQKVHAQALTLRQQNAEMQNGNCAVIY